MIKKTIIIIFTLFISSQSLSDNYQDVHSKFKNYYENYEYEKAELLIDKYLVLAEKEFGINSKKFAIVLSNISWLYEGLSKFDEAIIFQKKILDV